MAGETRVLLADGKHRPLVELEVGDEIYGTVRAPRFARSPRYPRLTRTRVVTCRWTVGPAHRITLADGTELVASADHRFLSTRGWKHVTGADQGNARRPHLTISSALRGVGGFAEPPDQNSEYQAGYLCGMVRGDGHLKSYVFTGRGRPERVHWFRLALADIEALHRARDFLALIQVPTKERVFSVATASRREIRAISTSTFRRVERVRDVMRWPHDPSDSWCKGFLAGIFDAEGSCGGSVIRISNTDPEIIDWVTSCLTRFGFDLVVETTRRANGLAVVRIRGGLVERLRFFHMTAPAITRKQRLDGHGIKTTVDLTVVSIEPLEARRLYAITTRTGDFIANGVVSHTSGAPSRADRITTGSTSRAPMIPPPAQGATAA